MRVDNSDPIVTTECETGRRSGHDLAVDRHPVGLRSRLERYALAGVSGLSREGGMSLQVTGGVWRGVLYYLTHRVGA